MLLKERGFLAIDRTHSLVQQVLAIRSAAMFVEGKIRQESIGWQLEIQLIEPKEDEVLWKKDFRLEEPPNLDVRRDEVMRDPETGVYLSGRGGIGSPRCIKCPNPEFTKEAIDKHISGRFVCLLTVSERGEPISPIGLTTLGHGLDEQAMEAIRKWKFQPAKDNQGKSVPVRVTIEVTFKQFG
jgi:TonB family protein